MKFYLLLAFFALQILNAGKANAQTAGAGGGKKLFTAPLGMQAYTYRDSWSNAIAVLDTIKALGITEFEGGNIKGYSDEETRKLLEERGIKVRSIGAGFDALTDDQKLQELVKKAKTLGATYIMTAWVPHGKTFTLEDAKKAVSAFNKAGKVFKDNGLTFCYHNHGYEFEPYEDGNLFDYIAKNTNPEYVSFEMDILWAFFGGQDPAKLLEKYGSRWKLMHVKDLRKGIQGNLTGLTDPINDVAVGEGQLNIPAIMKAAKKVGIRHYFIEDESPLHAEQIPRSIAYLRSLEDK
jgi:sugar phosphate isomerase/epimerase